MIFNDSGNKQMNSKGLMYTLKFFPLHVCSHLNKFIRIFKEIFSLTNICCAVLLGVNEKAIEVLCRVMTTKHK